MKNNQDIWNKTKLFQIEQIQNKILLTFPRENIEHYIVKDVTSECLKAVKNLMLLQLNSFDKTISYNWVDEKDRHIHLTLSVDNSY